MDHPVSDPHDTDDAPEITGYAIVRFPASPAPRLVAMVDPDSYPGDDEPENIDQGPVTFDGATYWDSIGVEWASTSTVHSMVDTLTGEPLVAVEVKQTGRVDESIRERAAARFALVAGPSVDTLTRWMHAVDDDEGPVPAPVDEPPAWREDGRYVHVQGGSASFDCMVWLAGEVGVDEAMNLWGAACRQYDADHQPENEAPATAPTPDGAVIRWQEVSDDDVPEVYKRSLTASLLKAAEFAAVVGTSVYSFEGGRPDEILSVANLGDRGVGVVVRQIDGRWDVAWVITPLVVQASPAPDAERFYPLLFEAETEETDEAIRFHLRSRGDAGRYVELSDGPSGITATATPHRVPIAVLAKRADVLAETAAALTVLARSVSEHADAALNVDPEGIPSR